MDKKISFIGIGRLGICFALLAEQAGYEVMGCDKREKYCEQLNRKELKTPEPQVEYLLQKSKNFTATTDIKKAFKFSDLLFVFVPTPSKENGEYDHQYIEEVVSDLLRYKESGNTIAGKSLIICATVMPTYCKELHERLINYGVNVLYCPSLIAQGSICNDMENADFVLIGCDTNYVMDYIFEVYHSIMKVEPVFRILTLTAAEITKIGINCFLTTKISYANMIAEIAIKSGEERSVKSILQTIGADTRIGTKYLNYGFGYAGVCLPRDGRALGIHADKVGAPSNMQKAVDEFNNIHLQFLKEKFIQENPNKENPFIFNQLSYKKGSDILTESQHYRLCKELLEEGYSVNIYESDAVLDLVIPEFSKYGKKVKYNGGAGTNSKFYERLLEGQRKAGYIIEL